MLKWNAETVCSASCFTTFNCLKTQFFWNDQNIDTINLFYGTSLLLTLVAIIRQDDWMIALGSVYIAICTTYSSYCVNYYFLCSSCSLLILVHLYAIYDKTKEITVNCLTYYVKDCTTYITLLNFTRFFSRLPQASSHFCKKQKTKNKNPLKSGVL